MKVNKKNTPDYVEDIISSDMSDVLIGAFNRYAKEVISDRAIPDVRDGLKPVQRRIIYDMFTQGQTYNKPTVKSATIVGHVMGHLHPHGDSSIYDSLVHMSQSWKMEAPLIAFQGNNGSIDDDPAAAYRYTEAKLSLLSEYLCRDLNKNVVRMIPTFDDKSLEPTVLPSRFPNLLVNGTQGIAVGSTTYIPPHNLAEVIDATIYRIKHKGCNLDDILQFIKGPDFPTGGIIDDTNAIRSIYESGKGSFYLYCKSHIDEKENSIVITQIPFGVVKIAFVAALNKRKDSDKLDNIEEIIDESAKDEVNIVIKIKENANPQDILNYLQTKGALRTTISCNYLAIDHGHPKTMPLLDVLDSYIAHQVDVSTKAYNFDLQSDKDRLEIVDGYMKCYSILNEIIEKIKKCSGKDGVKKMLEADYGFTPRQSEAIAMMPLYRLSNTDIVALKEEKITLEKDINDINDILNNPDLLDNTIVSTLKEIKKQFTTERKTEILTQKREFETVSTTKLIAKEDVYVSITYDGYSKRSTFKSYNAAQRANNDSDPLNLPKMKEGDHLVFNSVCNTHQFLLLFTNLGNYGYVPVYGLSDLKWKEEGKHINNLIKLSANEKIVKVFKLNEFREGLNVVILTKLNKIKRTTLKEYEQDIPTKKVCKACKLSGKDDRVVDVCISSGNSDLIIVDNLGRVSRFNENQIPLTAVVTQGVIAMSLGMEKAPLVSIVSLNSDEVTQLLCLSESRAVRIISSSKIDCDKRLGKKINLIKILKKNPFKIISVEKVNKRQSQIVSCVTTDMVYGINLTDLSPIDLGSEMRVNLNDIPSNQKIIAFNDFGEVIDENTKVEKPSITKVEIATKVKDCGTTQLSLFDMFSMGSNNDNNKED